MNNLKSIVNIFVEQFENYDCSEKLFDFITSFSDNF